MQFWDIDTMALQAGNAVLLLSSMNLQTRRSAHWELTESFGQSGDLVPNRSNFLLERFWQSHPLLGLDVQCDDLLLSRHRLLLQGVALLSVVHAVFLEQACREW